MKNLLTKYYVKAANYLKKEDGVNTIEILIIAVALIAVAVLFWDKIKGIGDSLFNKLDAEVNKVTNSTP